MTDLLAPFLSVLSEPAEDFTSFRAIGDPLGSPLVSFFVDERVGHPVWHVNRVNDVRQRGWHMVFCFYLMTYLG